MSVAPQIKGWCPSLLDPMPSGDGWLARIKPSAATLAADAARRVARLAARHGNGLIDLTSRANLQIRGLTPASAAMLAEEVIAHGLAAADPAREAMRNVMASPLGPNDRTAAFDSHAVARALEALLLDSPELERLPPKFCFLVDGGGVLPLRDKSADVMLHAAGGVLAITLESGGFAVPCTLTTAAETAAALARGALRLCRERRLPPLRMRRLIEATGEEAIFAAAGLTPVPQPSVAETTAPPIGFISYGQEGEGAFGVGLPFGRIDAGALASLAGLAERFGDGVLRTTPWRALLIAGLALSEADQLAGEAHDLGLIVDPGDARLLIQACVGAPACDSATVPARADAETLAAALGAVSETLHASGCAKSCAHRGPASVTLVGRDGRYDLVREGTANDKPALMGLRIEDAVALLAAAGGRQ